MCVQLSYSERTHLIFNTECVISHYVILKGEYVGRHLNNIVIDMLEHLSTHCNYVG